MKPVSVMLIDDHRIVRQELRAILDSDVRFRIVGEAGTGKAALNIIHQQRPDVALLDLKLPDIDGVELCRQIVRLFPDTRVLILTAFIDQNLVNACRRAGARGYLLKDATNLQLQEHLLVAARGQEASLPVPVEEPPEPTPDLGSDEREVLQLVAQGLTNQEIGEYFGLVEKDVQSLLQSVLTKLKAENRIEAVFRAQSLGLL